MKRCTGRLTQALRGGGVEFTEMQIELARIKLEADEMVLGKLLLSWHTSFGETGTRKILVKHKVPCAPPPRPSVG